MTIVCLPEADVGVPANGVRKVSESTVSSRLEELGVKTEDMRISRLCSCSIGEGIEIVCMAVRDGCRLGLIGSPYLGLC